MLNLIPSMLQSYKEKLHRNQLQYFYTAIQLEF